MEDGNKLQDSQNNGKKALAVACVIATDILIIIVFTLIMFALGFRRNGGFVGIAFLLVILKTASSLVYKLIMRK